MGYCTEDYHGPRATAASSCAIPFQEPHGSFPPPSPVLSFLPRHLAACSAVTFCCDFVSGSRNRARSPSAGRQVRL
eukprot:scaffold122746_cov84-Phaeocystis_antarctica.AAC.2